MIHRLLPRCTNSQQVKSLPPHDASLGSPVLAQEALRFTESLSQLVRPFRLSGVRNVSKEDQDLEFGICWAKILEFVWPGVGRPDESLRKYTLADEEPRSKRLVGDVGYRGRSVMDSYSRGKPPKGLESPVGRVSCEPSHDNDCHPLTLRIVRGTPHPGSPEFSVFQRTRR